MYGYEWTEENGIFRLTINAKIQKEIRPVFHEELDFFGMDQYWDYPKDTTAPLLWAEGVRRYVLNGVCVAEAQGGGFYTKPTIKRLTEERLKLVPIDTDTGVDCFDLPDQDKVLGKDQYKALKQWVAESGILKIETKGSKKVVLPELTVLGNKLINIGVYNPFGWAVMWANLAYNSIVVNAFCLNIGVGETFNKDDIVGILKYDNATACDHAANSLLSTFRDSPIGSSLMQGIQLDKDYYRAGWEYPHAVALLYALYLYAEHTGRKSFTFSELVNAHSNPDAKGISPADIYGIDVKKFREDVQGLAISFPKHIRVSFVANLDNIILEDYSSDDIIDLAEE